MGGGGVFSYNITKGVGASQYYIWDGSRDRIIVIRNICMPDP